MEGRAACRVKIYSKNVQLCHHNTSTVLKYLLVETKCKLIVCNFKSTGRSMLMCLSLERNVVVHNYRREKASECFV